MPTAIGSWRSRSGSQRVLLVFSKKYPAVGQAASDRLLGEGLVSLSSAALGDVSLFVSCGSVNKTSTNVRAELETWWVEVGRQMLLGADPFEDCEPEDLELVTVTKRMTCSQTSLRRRLRRLS